MTQFIEIFVQVLKILKDNDIKYMVVGSLAAMVYGDPGLTRVMDLVVEISPNDAEKLEKLFPLDRFYCPPIEVLKFEIVHRGQFNFIHHDSGLKVDVMIKKQSEHAIEEFNRRQEIALWEGFIATVATAEDVIIKKLDFYRMGGSEKHLTDIRRIVAETALDNDYLNKWIIQLGLANEWKKTK